VDSPVLLLDLDRTLVDLQSFTDYAAALADVQALTGEWPDADVPDTDWDHPTQACMSVLHALLGDARWTVVSNAIAVHERAAVPLGVVMPTVGEVLDRLRDAGAGVVTLLPVDVATQALARHGIGVGPGEPVDLVIGRDPRIRPKPWPDGLLAACARLGAAPDRATMIGDATWDQEAAARAGAGFVGVPSSPAGFAPGVPVVRTFAEAVRLVLGE
jgi:phosphoglycolate phosphatase-like HAD superfamily hydrolase